MKRLCILFLLVAGLAGLSTSMSGRSQAATTAWAYLHLKVAGVPGTVVANPPGVLVNPECPDGICVLAYPEGTPVTLTPMNSWGTWMGWRTIPGKTDPRCGNVTVCSTTVSGTMGIKAAFSPVELTVNSNFDGGWVELRTPGADCGPGCRRYEYGTSVAIRAHKRYDGYSFSGWYGGCEGIGPGCRFNMLDNRRISAIFRCHLESCKTADPITTTVPVTIVVRGPGTAAYRGISCRGTCKKNWPKRSLLSIEARANAGASVAGWGGSVNCASSGTRCSFPVFADSNGNGPVVEVNFR